MVWELILVDSLNIDRPSAAVKCFICPCQNPLINCFLVSCRFTWSSANSQCNSPYTYCEEGNYIGTVSSHPLPYYVFMLHYYCTLKQQAILLIETVAGTSIDHFLSNHFVGNGTFPSGFPSQESQNAAHCSQSSWSEEQPQESPSTWDTAACVGSKVTSHNIKLICLNSQWRCSDNLWLLSLSVFCPSPSWHPQLSCFVQSVIQNLKISSLF